MAQQDGCPCETVRELKEIVFRHERQLNEGSTNFALIKKDLDYIKGKLDERKKFNSGIISSIISAIISGACMIMMAYIAAKLGFA